jgi:hypothetical protein
VVLGWPATKGEPACSDRRDWRVRSSSEPGAVPFVSTTAAGNNLALPTRADFAFKGVRTVAANRAQPALETRSGAMGSSD